MSLVRKMAVFCNGCGMRQDIEWDDRRGIFSPMSTIDTPLEGWREVGKDQHLCPECYPAYEERKAEHKRELDKMLGVKTIEFDL